MDKRRWLKNAKIRLIATLSAGAGCIIAAGVVDGWRGALLAIAGLAAGCVAYSLKKLFKKREGDKK